jgi:integrase
VYPAFLILILYGLRRGEVLGLHWDDIDLDDGTILVELGGLEPPTPCLQSKCSSS